MTTLIELDAQIATLQNQKDALELTALEALQGALATYDIADLIADLQTASTGLTGEHKNQVSNMITVLTACPAFFDQAIVRIQASLPAAPEE